MRKLARRLLIVLVAASVLLAAPLRACPKRIVSMSPVGTEILYALGQEDRVVGVTDFCDYPPEVRKKPKIGGFAEISLEKLIAMKVDLLVLSDIHLRYKDDLDKLKIPCVFIMQDTLASMYRSIFDVGRVCGAEKRAAMLVAKMKADVDAVRAKVEGLPRRRVVLSVSRELAEPQVNVFYAAGRRTFYNELLEAAGGVNVVPPSHAEYPRISSEGLMVMDPEVIIDIVGEPEFYHSMENTDVDRIFNKKNLKEQWMRGPGVSAVRMGRVVILDGTVYLRPGPRVGRIALSFAKALHPEARW